MQPRPLRYVNGWRTGAVALAGGVDLFEERQQVRAGVPLAQVCVDLTGTDVHRREQIDRAVFPTKDGLRAP